MLKWKQERQGSTALLIEGARRVGKSYIVELFARNEYDSYIFVDFTDFDLTLISLILGSHADWAQRCGDKNKSLPQIVAGICFVCGLRLLNHAAGTHVAGAVVLLAGVALGDAAVHGGVDKLESTLTILVYLGDDAHVADAVANGATVEEHEVAGLQVLARDAAAVMNLGAAAAVKGDAELLEHITGEARAVEGAGRHGTMAIGHATELEGVTQQLADDATLILAQ